MGEPLPDGHIVEAMLGSDRIVTMPTAYDVGEANRASDVVVHASFMGVWPARFMAQFRPRAIIGADCGIGKDGAGIAGLWYLEALGLPAAAADVSGIQLLNGADVYRNGVVSRHNALAEDCGVEEGMPVNEAATLLMKTLPLTLPPRERAVRVVVASHPSGRQIVCTPSIAFPLPEDRDHNVLCTGGFAGLPNILKASPYGFICSDGGRGRDDSGLAGLWCGIPGAAVDVQTARIGDGLSTYREGMISACNEEAEASGVHIGQTAVEAAWALVSRG
jgi:hypothetical protein